MELALPHVVVRAHGAGLGTELIAALSVHPIEISEAHDAWELRRVAGGRPALLVVMVDPPDARSAVAESWADLPAVPILVISDRPESFICDDAAYRGWVDATRSSQPVSDLCWHVLEALSRAARLPGVAERPLGPDLIEVDATGIVHAAVDAGGEIDGGLRLRPGDSLLSIVDPLERTTIAHMLAWSGSGEAQFSTARLLGEHGHRHPVALGVRRVGDGRAAVLVQPLVFGGSIVGRHVSNRDPITGLLTRWAMSRALEARERRGPPAGEAAVILATLDEFSAIGNYIGHAQTDDVLQRVAAAVNDVFPYPALTSRLMGDSFLTCVVHAGNDEPLLRAERLLRSLGDIEVPEFAPRFTLRASIGVADVIDGDHDLAIRLAEAAAGEARAAGGNRVVVAGSAPFTGAQARELTASMDRGSWEVWLQPVSREPGGAADYHETLARFDAGHRPLASRADFFIAGRAKGLLERFDRMMLQRALEILESHPDARLAVNVTYETFVSQSFPASWLELIRRVPDGCRRIILEVASRCMAAPDDVVGPRLDALAAAGVAVALDDFGSGICRLSYLTQRPLAIVKLDQLVTGYIDDDPLQRDFVRTVVSLCRARGITTVAEYTRSTEQLARLVADGVDLFQGELFGMPRPVAETLAAPRVAAAHA